MIILNQNWHISLALTNFEFEIQILLGPKAFCSHSKVKMTFYFQSEPENKNFPGIQKLPKDGHLNFKPIKLKILVTFF